MGKYGCVRVGEQGVLRVDECKCVGATQCTGSVEVLTNLLTVRRQYVEESLGQHVGSVGGHPISPRNWATGCVVETEGIHTGRISVRARVW